MRVTVTYKININQENVLKAEDSRIFSTTKFSETKQKFAYVILITYLTLHNPIDRGFETRIMSINQI